MIVIEDIKNEIELSINDVIKKNNYINYEIIKNSPLIKSEILEKLYSNHNLLEDNNLTISSKFIIDKLYDKLIINIIETNNKRKLMKKGILDKLDKLKKLKLPEQRSQEWYDMREKILTASSLADCLGKGHFKSRDDLLIEKTSKDPIPRFTNHIIEWGVRYEPVATTFYEKLNNVKVLEFGLVPHPEFTIFGASPDGICDIGSNEEYIGRMLEIKCPPIRKFTKEVPHHYWMQMQGQLETCDLEECDFLQVKIEEYKSEKEYLEDKYGTSKDGTSKDGTSKDGTSKDGTSKDGITSKGFPKGLVLSFVKIVDGKEQYHYEYSEFNKSFDDIKSWSENIIENYPLEFNKIVYHWWKIERYECTLVYRDREWWLDTMPKILDFWEDVEHYRKIGNQELIDKKKKKKNKGSKKKPDKNIITITKEINEKIEKDYLLESSDEEK